MAVVIPAIIPKSYADLAEHVLRVSAFVSRVQVDVVDGVFAKNRTWPLIGDDGAFQKIKAEAEGLPAWEYVEYEIDLLVADPASVFDDWVKAGASALVIHRESADDQKLQELIVRAKDANIEIGIALNPSTSVDSIMPFVPEIAFIQCMGNDHTGEQGVSLDPAVLSKIADIRKRFPESMISIDIGVNKETAPKLVAAGANKLVSGSAIFESKSPKEIIDLFQSL
jgi:ribulose-phosphate 3-epimerase